MEVAAEAGLDFVHHNGAEGQFYYPEIMIGGGAFLDYDNDGFLDVYLVQGGTLPLAPKGEHRNQLFHNLGDGTFEDVTSVAGVGDLGYGGGVAAADYDGDGWVDLYVTNLGPNRLYRNNGDGSFSEVATTAGVGDPGFSSSAAFTDYDADGDLDLFVCNYVVWSPTTARPCIGRSGLRAYCNPAEYAPQHDTLYRNEGNGTFSDVSVSAGIRSARGPGLGVVTADFDGDGRIDIYVTNDQQPNHLWMNQGDGTFREEALLRGAALNELGQPEAGMGVVTEDPDHDGDWDLFMVHLSGETNTFYRNDGGRFRDVTDQLRLGSVSQPYTGFGTAFFDYDNDGTLDLFIANGKVTPGNTAELDYREPNQLLRGLGDGLFEDVSAQAGEALALYEVSRGAAFGDYDNDGDVDILVVNNGGPVRLLRNEIGSRRHWLAVELCGAGSYDRSAIGAIITIEVGGRTRMRQVQPSSGYCTSGDPRVYFGLGDSESVDRLVILWPDGATTERRGISSDQILRVRAPHGSSDPGDGVCSGEI